MPLLSLPPFAVAGGLVLVPDLDSPGSPMVPAMVLRVIDPVGVRGGVVDVRVLGRDYDPDGGFRLGDTLAPLDLSGPALSSALAAIKADDAAGRFAWSL